MIIPVVRGHNLKAHLILCTPAQEEKSATENITASRLWTQMCTKIGATIIIDFVQILHKWN